jgi:hypothetical protein
VRTAVGGDVVGDGNELVRLDESVLGVGPHAGPVGNPITGVPLVDSGSRGFDGAGRFQAEDDGELSQCEGAVAKHGVDEVDTDKLVPQQHLARAGRGQRALAVPEDLGAAVGMDPHDAAHALSPPSMLTVVPVMKPASGPARKATSAPISAGSANRLREFSDRCNSALGPSAGFMSVSTAPG